MALDELRGKARLTPENLKAVVQQHDEVSGLKYWSPKEVADAATDQAIAVMMEEFKAVVAAGEDLTNWLYEQELGGEYRTILGDALSAHSDLQEEIDHV